MIVLRLIRLEETDEGAIGVLLFRDKVFCMTLEPDSSDDRRFQIPCGIYPLLPFSGTKWKNTIEIVVSGHTALLFHAGNVEEESLGCVLLGSDAYKLYGDRAVLNSGNTFRRFQKEVVPEIKPGDKVMIGSLIDFWKQA